MKVDDVSKHFTEVNRSVLEEKQEYAVYFNYIKSAFSHLIHSFNSRTTDEPIEVGIIQSFIQKFLNSIEALSHKYALEEGARMRIDLTESSFPSHLEFKKLNLDMTARPAKLSELPAFNALKQSTLDFMFEKHSVPDLLIDQLNQRDYYESIDSKRLFMEFCPGDLVNMKNSAGHDGNHYIYSWGEYSTAFNRPFIYLLIFELDKTSTKNQVYKRFNFDEFQEFIRKSSNATSPLRVMAHDIDALGDGLKPKVLKRIDLGPIYGRYSMDQNTFSKLIQDKFGAEDFVMHFTTEVIFSVGESRTRSFLSKGELRQIFFIDESNKEAMERHVSKVLKYMIAPHHVVQYLHANHKELLEEFSMEPIAV